MLIPALANGATMDAMMPLAEKSNGPLDFKHRHPASRFVASGIKDSEQRIESSSPVRVIEKKSPAIAQLGISSSLSSGQTANVSCKRVRDGLLAGIRSFECGGRWAALEHTNPLSDEPLYSKHEDDQSQESGKGPELEFACVSDFF